ncbi:MAG: hypothetical protein AAF532_07935 [Planctomycetota bacterium]
MGVRFVLAGLLIFAAVPARHAVGSESARPEEGPFEASHRDGQGYLIDLLRRYDVEPSSQTLVYSKTSLQTTKINPNNPRALYFNDDVYIGFVPGGDALEVMATGPDGAAFFTVSQQPDEPPLLEREHFMCNACHETGRTGNVPGFLTQSLHVDENGRKIPNSDDLSFFRGRVDHTTPLAERWGGWYATGLTGDMTHRGNLMRRGDRLDSGHGGPNTNETDLTWWFDPGKYVTDTADVVALLVFEHQLTAHNLMTRATFTTRSRLNNGGYDKDARLSELDAETAAAIDRQLRPVLEYMLFVGEADLTDRVVGGSTFAAEFTARGPFDDEGRTLRAFDLETRMFKHRLSYLVHSHGFREMPPAALDSFGRQLAEVLAGRDEQLGNYFTADEAAAIESILRATEPGLLPE